MMKQYLNRGFLKKEICWQSSLEAPCCNPATAQQDKAPNDLEIAHIAAKFEDCDGVEV